MNDMFEESLQVLFLYFIRCYKMRSNMQLFFAKWTFDLELVLPPCLKQSIQSSEAARCRIMHIIFNRQFSDPDKIPYADRFTSKLPSMWSTFLPTSQLCSDRLFWANLQQAAVSSFVLKLLVTMSLTASRIHVRQNSIGGTRAWTLCYFSLRLAAYIYVQPSKVSILSCVGFERTHGYGTTTKSIAPNENSYMHITGPGFRPFHFCC